MVVKKGLTQKFGKLRASPNLILAIIVYHQIKIRVFQENYIPVVITQLQIRLSKSI